MRRFAAIPLALGSSLLSLCLAPSCFVEVPKSRQAAESPCPDGSADCDGDGTCETDVTSDAESCGWCGHDCLGTSCAQSVCQPVVVRPNLTYPHLVAVDDTHVFWTEGGGGFGQGVVGRCNKTGSAPTELVSQAYKPRGIALSDDYVYWTDGKNGTLHRVPKDGGADEELADPAWEDEGADAIGDSGATIAGGRVYWTHPLAGAVYGADLDGGDFNRLIPETVDARFKPQHVAVLDGFVYVANRAAAEVRRVPVGGGAVEIIASAPEPAVSYSAGITTAAGAIYLRETLWGPGEYGRVARLDGDGLNWTIIASTPGALALASDDAALFWTGTDGTVSRADLDGSHLRVLATGQTDPTGVAEDEDAVYWTNRAINAPDTGAIMRVAK